MLSLVVAEAKGRKQMEKQKQARRSRLKSRILTLLVVEVAMQGTEVGMYGVRELQPSGVKAKREREARCP